MSAPIVHLVACTKAKRAGSCPARELYAASDWFAKARAYVEGEGGPWFILSAKHGLVHPDRILAPYEVALADLDRAARRRWAVDVRDDLRLLGVLAGAPQLVFLAGRLYRTDLVELLGRDRCAAPLARLGLGEQKAWFTAHRRRAAA